MMQRSDADALAATLEPLLPDYEVTAVPWGQNDSPKAEHIVTIWVDDEVLVDIFGYGRNTFQYVARKAARGAEVFRAYSAEGIAMAIKEGAR